MFYNIICHLLMIRLIVCTEATVVNIGAIFANHEQGNEFNWEAISKKIPTDFQFSEPRINYVGNGDNFDSVKILCEMASEDNGLIALFGPENQDLSSTLESACNHLNIPFILTGWIQRNSKEIETTFNLFPEASLLAKAYARIIESLDWDSFFVLYEDEEGLIKLQDILKLQIYKEGETKNSLMLRKLEVSGDNRHIFKSIKETTISRIVLDCKTENIIEYLRQAKEVKLLTDFTTSFFLTSMDAHTVDFSPLNTKSNITTVRLFDPSTPNFQQIVNEFYPTLDPETITVKTAMMYDGMNLLSEAINAIKSENPDIIFEPLSCNETEQLTDHYGLIAKMHEIDIPDALTGKIHFENGKRDSFELQIVEFDKLDQPIGIWSSDEPDSIHLTRNATEREAEIQRRLQNHNFIVTSRIIAPYLFKNEDPEAKGNAQFYGHSMDLISEVAKILNITFEFRLTKDSSPKQLVIDLMERNADLAICDFTITPERREKIDFSMPFMTLGIGILHKKAEADEEVSMYGFLGPLSTTVWIYIGALYLVISIILVLIARMSTEDWENPHPCDPKPSELENIWDFKNCCWLTLGSITTQGCDILPKGICSRIATASWWFFSLIITSSYTANLAAFLTMSKIDDTIKSVEELATQSKVKYGCLDGGSTSTFLAQSNNSLYQRMWNIMQNEKPSVFESSNAKGVDRIQSTKNGLYAFFMESTGIEYELERKCDLRRIGNLLDSKSYGIGMPMNADYRHSINAAVLKLQETGKLIELKAKWWKEHKNPCPTEVTENSDALALENVGGVFVVLSVCIGLAFLIAILEFLWNVHNVAVEEHISFLAALKIEVKFACNIFITKKRVKPLLSEAASSKSDVDMDGGDDNGNVGIIDTAASLLSVHDGGGSNRRTVSQSRTNLNVEEFSNGMRKSKSKSKSKTNT